MDTAIAVSICPVPFGELSTVKMMRSMGIIYLYAVNAPSKISESKKKEVLCRFMLYGISAVLKRLLMLMTEVHPRVQKVI